MSKRGSSRNRVDDDDYRRLLEFRTAVRRFLASSTDRAQSAGLTAAQHQLLLAIRGHPRRLGPTIGDVAAYLLIKHHSAVEPVDRAEGAGFVERRSDPSDHRAVRLSLTRAGRTKLERVTRANLEDLARLDAEFPDVRISIEAQGRSQLP